MKISKKKLIPVKHPFYYIDEDTFSGTIEEITAKLGKIKKELMSIYYNPLYSSHSFDNPDTYEVMKIRIERNWSAPTDFILEIFRYETDEEFNARIQKEKEDKRKKELARKKAERARKKNLEIKEREEFERLKKKYGDK